MERQEVLDRFTFAFIWFIITIYYLRACSNLPPSIYVRVIAVYLFHTAQLC